MVPKENDIVFYFKPIGYLFKLFNTNADTGLNEDAVKKANETYGRIK